MIFRNILLLATVALLAAGCNDHQSGGHSHGHHSHDGGHEHASHDEEAPMLQVTQFSQELEVYAEYPPLVRGEKSRFLIHATWLKSGMPLHDTSLAIELRKKEVDPTAPPFVVEIGMPSAPGIYPATLQFGTATSYHLTLRFSAGEEVTRIALGEVAVFATAHDAEHDAEHHKLTTVTAIPFTMEQQWKTSLRLAQAAVAPLSERLVVPATLESPPGGEVAVSVPVPGRLKRIEKGKFITAGEKVTKGEVLAALELAPEIASRVQQAQVKRDFAKRTFERVATIRKKGVGSAQQYEQAKEKLELAEAEYRSLLGSSQVTLLASDSDKLLLPLSAPVSGEIVSAKQQEGAYIAANEELFRVLNNEIVWVEARVSEFDISRLHQPKDAALRLDAYAGEVFLIQDLGGRLINIGTRVDLQSRTVAVRYELPNPDGKLKIGMFGTVAIASESPKQRLVIPEAAIINESGVPTAYVLLTGERFEKRELKLGVSGAGIVEVLSGISEGEWVVEEGAYALKLAAIAPSSFGHGHVH